MKLIPIAYLSSFTLSLLGNSIAAVALPLLVLQTTGSALSAGIVAAATAIPAFITGLLMGVLIDRFNRRTSSMVTDIISAASIAALPLIDMVSGLNLGWFVLFGIIGSLGDVPGMTARDALLPAVIRHGKISAERITGVQEGLGALMILVGPATAGTLMVLFDGATVLWVTAATSLLAAVITLFIPHQVGAIALDDETTTLPGTSSARAGNSWKQLQQGWRTLFHNRLLLSITTVMVTMGLVLAGFQGLVIPVYFTAIREPGMLGFFLSSVAFGMLLGSAMYAIAGSRGQRRTWFIVGVIGSMVGVVVFASLASVWIVLVGAFVLGLSNGLFSAMIGVLMIERTPEQMRGRIMGTQNSIMTIAPTIGIVAAALLTEYAGLSIAAFVLAASWVVIALATLKARSLRTLEPRVEAASETVTEVEPQDVK